MGRSMYDTFRAVQATKNTVYNRRSASFIIEGLVSNDITHVRKEKTKKAALVFNHKEGPDDVIVYTLKEPDSTLNELMKGDYFLFDDVYYLIYEDVKMNDKSVPYKKQRAVECNVNFSVDDNTFIGCFISSMRSFRDTKLEKNMIVTNDQEPAIILPSNSLLTVGSGMKIKNRSWKIIDFDDITNNGITYYYVRPSANVDSVLAPGNMGNGVDPSMSDSLYPMIEYKFPTNDAYFAANPRVHVVKKTRTSVDFMVPFGSSSVVISTKNDSGDIVEKTYEVIL